MSVKFNPVKDIPDLTGKVVVVTGGTAGLGTETVKQLALHHPSRIYVTARSVSKANSLIDSLSEGNIPKSIIHSIDMDLSSLSSVRHAADQIISSTDRIDVLVLNAGISLVPPSLTAEGYEWHFGVNHMAHALFTQLLAPTLLRTAKTVPNADVRIVSVSSVAAAMFPPNGGLLLDRVKTNMENPGPRENYAQSKLANIFFARKLARLYEAQGITSVSVHPGLVNTENFSKGTGSPWLFKAVWKLSLILNGDSVEDGAKNQLWAAVADKSRLKNGAFYMPVGSLSKGSKYEDNDALMEELWTFTNEELQKHGGVGWPN